MCVNNQINLLPRWIPRNLNQEADNILSRTGDNDDWSVSQSLFDVLNTKWGPHTVDRFANDYNAKFNSRWWCTGTECVDTFVTSWKDEINWLVSPPRLIMKTLDKLYKECTSGTLIVPEWSSAPFWPLLFPEGKNGGIHFGQF